MNKVELVGRITKDPNISYTKESTCVARFTMAMNRRFKKDEADFISCVAFGKQGEFMEKYAKKGMKFEVVGRLQSGSYKNKDGQTVYTTDVVVEEIEFGEGKSEKKDTEPADFVNIPDDELSSLPFN